MSNCSVLCTLGRQAREDQEDDPGLKPDATSPHKANKLQIRHTTGRVLLAIEIALLRFIA
jgi:hypothetical protein